MIGLVFAPANVIELRPHWVNESLLCNRETELGFADEKQSLFVWILNLGAVEYFQHQSTVSTVVLWYLNVSRINMFREWEWGRSKEKVMARRITGPLVSVGPRHSWEQMRDAAVEEGTTVNDFHGPKMATCSCGTPKAIVPEEVTFLCNWGSVLGPLCYWRCLCLLPCDLG